LILNLNPKAETKLPELITKQDKKNIRYISDDGKYTYYQRSNGIFQFSTNYKVEEVIKLAERTQFNLIAGNSHKFMILEANEHYNDYLSLNSKSKLYIIEYGTKNIKKMAKGIPIGLHLKDVYLSYYDPYSRSLVVQSHLNPSIKTTIKLANTINPYFIPQVVMTDIDTIIYTDLNSQGIPGVLIHKINSGKTQILEKLDTPNKQIEICLKGNKLFLAEYGLDPLTSGSSISYFKTKKLSLDTQTPIYQSEENDIGSLKCNFDDHSIYIVKTARSENGKITYDAVEINVDTKNIQNLSDIHFVTSLVVMDGKLLIPYQNKHYVIKGASNLTKFDQLHSKE